MILYIIKSVLCSTLFIAAYHLLLEKETIHRFKRWYLLMTLILSLVIPLITIEIDQAELASQISTVSQYFVANTPATHSPELSPAASTASENLSPGFHWSTILLIGYGMITAVLLLRIFNNFLSILTDVSAKTVKPYRETILVVHNKHVIPYSFLNYIFISHHDIDNKQILLHELTHIRQKHTLDILLVEFIHCLMWFNPAILFYKKSIRLNHEFLADEVVIKNYPTADYQNTLFQKTQASSGLSLTSSFNYSATKKRFIMMTKSKNQTRSMIKITFSVIAVCCTGILFTEKVYAQNDSIPQVIDQNKVQDSTMIAAFDTLIFKFIRYKKDKAGKEYMSINVTGITDGEKSRMREIYKVMTDEQKAKYPKHIDMVFMPIPPPKKQSPTAQQLADFADPTVYGIWLDGKRVPNTELAKYKPSDIALVSKSRLMKNAAHYGQYKFHTEVMTHAYFDKTYPVKSN